MDERDASPPHYAHEFGEIAWGGIQADSSLPGIGVGV